MNRKISNSVLSLYLKEKNNVTGWLNYFKIVYRPYICPFNLMLKYIPEGSAIFDIGCGQGQFSLILTGFIHPRMVKGIDVNEDAVNEARQLFSSLDFDNASFQCYNGIDLPADIINYSLITMVDVFHHIPPEQQETFIRNLHGRMYEGQTLLIKDIDAKSPMVWGNRLHDILLTGRAGNEVGRADMKRLLINTGFKIKNHGKKRMLWYPHYWFAAVK